METSPLTQSLSDYYIWMDEGGGHNSARGNVMRKNQVGSNGGMDSFLSEDTSGGTHKRGGTDDEIFVESVDRMLYTLARETQRYLMRLSNEIKASREDTNKLIRSDIMEAIGGLHLETLTELKAIREENVSLRRELESLKTYISQQTMSSPTSNRGSNGLQSSAISTVRNGNDPWSPPMETMETIKKVETHLEPFPYGGGSTYHSRFNSKNRKLRSISWDELSDMIVSGTTDEYNSASTQTHGYKPYLDRTNTPVDNEFELTKLLNTNNDEYLLNSLLDLTRKKVFDNLEEEYPYYLLTNGSLLPGNSGSNAPYQSNSGDSTLRRESNYDMNASLEGLSKKEIEGLMNTLLKHKEEVGTNCVNRGAEPPVSPVIPVTQQQNYTHMHTPYTATGSEWNNNKNLKTSKAATIWSTHTNFNLAEQQQQRITKEDGPLTVNKNTPPLRPTSTNDGVPLLDTWNHIKEVPDGFVNSVVDRNPAYEVAYLPSTTIEERSDEQSTNPNRSNKCIVTFTCSIDPEKEPQNPSNGEPLQNSVLRIEWRVFNISVLAAHLQPNESLISPCFNSECELGDIYIKMIVRNSSEAFRNDACTFGLYFSVNAAVTMTYVLQCGKERKPPRTHSFSVAQWDGYENFSQLRNTVDSADDTMRIALEVLEYSCDTPNA